MKKRPIIFSAPMVRALLAGKKTQTRRVLPTMITLGRTEYPGKRDRQGYSRVNWLDTTEGIEAAVRECKYGQPGDRLWVRERFRALECGEIDYFADGKEVWERMQDHLPLPDAAKWKPSIHMPRWASRIMLEVTEVRVERLQDISPDDCSAEGISHHHDIVDCRRTDYSALWESINSPGSWDANPWVWVVEFERVKL